MSTTAIHPINRRTRRAAALAALLAGAAVAFGTASLTDSSEISPVRTPSVDAAKPWPGKLTARERAVVIAGLRSRDAASRQIAEDVASGAAGTSALADPAMQHHHGVSTAEEAPPAAGSAAAERFHHR